MSQAPTSRTALEPIAPCYGAREPWSAMARPPLRASPITGRACLIGRWIMLAELYETWIGSHEIGSGVTPIMRLLPRHLPASSTITEELVTISDRLGAEAARAVQAPVLGGGVCQDCGRSYDWSEGNTSDACCFRCAEARGVVF